MKAGQRDSLPMQHWLENFLLMYRATAHATTGASPSSLFLGRDVRTRMHLVNPPVDYQVAEKQASQKSQHDRRAKAREYHIGQEVTVRNLRPGAKFVPGVVIERQGPLVTWLQSMMAQACGSSQATHSQL